MANRSFVGIRWTRDFSQKPTAKMTGTSRRDAAHRSAPLGVFTGKKKR